MNIVEEWAKHIVQTHFETFDTELVEQAKNRIIDIIGCAIGGANAPGCAMLRDLIKRWGGKKEATILVHGIKAPAHNAAWMNSIMGRSYDYGVITPYMGDKPVPGHFSESTVPTAVTVAEWRNASGKELITALILGEDIATRLSDASKYTPGFGWDSPGIVNKFGTTAIAGKLLGLNEYQLASAFGILIDQLAGSFQSINDGTHSFKLSTGLAARDGVITAELAKEGWIGCKDPLLGKYGYFALYCQDSDPAILTRNLGKEFYAYRAVFKPYPSCGFTHSPIDCALTLVNKYDIIPEEIAEVTIDVAPMHLGGTLDQPFVLGGSPQGTASFSFRYTVANALIRKSSKPEHFTEEFIRDPKVSDLIKKMKVISTISADKVFAAEVFAAKVSVRMKDGQQLSASVDTPKGMPPDKMLTKEEIVEKFRGNVAFSRTVPEKKAEKALKLINRLEKVEDTGELVELLVI